MLKAERATSARERATRPVGAGILTALVALVVGCWVLAAPRSAGPDEPGHVVFSAGIVRGDLDGRPHPTDPALRRFDLPAWVGTPDPACWAQKPTVAASCADELPRPEGTAAVHSRVADSPIWGHVLPGLGTLAPSGLAPWLSRLLAAVVPVALVGAALARIARHSRLALSAALLALTPLAWFTFAVVNPSGLAIAGGFALWAAATMGRSGDGGDWLAAAGWAAVVLPRRDGLVWASLILLAVLLSERRSLAAWWVSLRRGPRTLVVAATLLAVHWSVTSGPAINRLAVLAPVGVILVEATRPVARRVLTTRLRHAIAAVFAIIATGGLLVGLVMWRSDVDTGEIAGRTGQHLEEAIGVLGWVDTPIPGFAVYLWFITLGILAAVALIQVGWRPLAVAGTILATAITVSWVVQLVHESTLGPYWQGRYYLPLLLGAPLVLGRAELDEAIERRLALTVTTAVVVVWNLAIVAAVRRWSVGIDGSLWPWRWGGYDVPVPPLALIGVHLGATALLATAGWRRFVTEPATDIHDREMMIGASGGARPRPSPPPRQLDLPQPVAGA